MLLDCETGPGTWPGCAGRSGLRAPTSGQRHRAMSGDIGDPGAVTMARALMFTWRGHASRVMRRYQRTMGEEGDFNENSSPFYLSFSDMWVNNCRLLGGNGGLVWWGTRPVLGSGDQRLIPGIRPVSRDMGEKPIVWDIWGSGRNKKWDPVFSSHDSQRNSYIPPWRSYVIVGCLRTNMVSDNEAYRICRTQGFYFTHQEPFHSDGWVPTFSLTQKTLNDVPLIMSHPQIKMIAQRVHFHIKF